MSLTLLELTDGDLIQQIRHHPGKASGAFRQLLTRYQTPVYHYIYRLCREESWAAELTQDVFLQCYRKLDLFDEHRTFKPWLFRIATNITLSALRKQRPTVSLSALQEEPTWKEPVSLIQEDHASTVDQKMQNQETIEVIQQALSQLDPKYRSVLLLRYNEDFSYEEMAESLKVPLNTVRTWLKRAREALKKSVNKAGLISLSLECQENI
ncbi:MAG: RNA polymerase sigma factor [Cyanobacteria bacterium]|nr:RNA polymerase sigma factor [Cyanobacteriota bacterium]